MNLTSIPAVYIVTKTADQIYDEWLVLEVRSGDMDAFEQSELNNHVLTKMPENQRIILTLFYLSELEVDEIAALLNLPSGTVKSRLHTAREAFRKLSVPSEPPIHPQKSLLP